MRGRGLEAKDRLSGKERRLQLHYTTSVQTRQDGLASHLDARRLSWKPTLFRNCTTASEEAAQAGATGRQFLGMILRQMVFCTAVRETAKVGKTEPPIFPVVRSCVPTTANFLFAVG